MSVLDNPIKTILEPSRKIPVLAEADICVVGGSCTGVFAAVRAARLGAGVVLIEKQNCFGGTATSGLVNIWHSLHDIDHKEKIIGGLTEEMLQRLRRRNGVICNPFDEQMAYKLDTEELKFELDRLVLDEKRIRPMLHTLYAGPVWEDGELRGVIVESKSGRGAILARAFVDASGDGDLAAHCGVPFAIHKNCQPPSTCAKIWDMPDLKKCNWQALIEEHGEEFSLKSGFPWFAEIPGVPKTGMAAASRVFGANCADAEQLTAAEFEGRRQIRATIDLVRKYGPKEYNPRVLALSSNIGIRETRRFNCGHRLTEEQVLEGVRFDDAIANGTYRVDIHNNDRTGITFKYLDGRQEFARQGFPRETSRWKPEGSPYARFYQMPYRSLVPQNSSNLILAGRTIDGDRGAFAALRVMVNTNQTGEAAGVAAWIAINKSQSFANVDTSVLRRLLSEGGSIVA